MKKFSFFKIASLALVCVMLLGAFMFTTLAADDAGESTVEIVSNNVYFGDTLHIMYAVKAPEGAEIDITAVDSHGIEIDVIPFNGDNDNNKATVKGIECYLYILKVGVAAQAIDEQITVTVKADNQEVVKTYSVLQYVYERMYVDNVEGNERAMFEALIDYANAANVFIDKDSTDFKNYKYVTVVGGTFDGNNTAGMFLPGATPFTNIIANADYDSSAYNVEWDVSVNGAEAVRYTNDQIKTLEITDKTTVTRVLVKSECDHDWSEATCTTLSTCSKCKETTGVLAEHAWVDATCSAPKTCTVCGETEGEANSNNHNFVDGTCACGAVQATLTLSIKDYAAANGWVNGVQYSTIKMDSNITVTATKTGNTGKYYTNGYDWRLYQSDDAAITIATTSGNIISVKVTYAMANTGTLVLEGANIASGTVVEVNAKSVTFTVGNTSTATNGQAKVTAIEVVYGVEPHDCSYSNATCAQKATCTICGKTTGDFAAHTWVDATCKDPQTCSVCEETQGEALGHTTENGTCERCGQVFGGEVAKMPTTKYSFSAYTAGKQYAEGEEHQLDDDTKLIINGAHLNTQVRLYAGSNCVLEFAKTVEKIDVNAGYKAGTLTVYVSEDGEKWTKIKAISTTTSYTSYSVDLGGSYQYVKLESAGGQIRVSILTVNP